MSTKSTLDSVLAQYETSKQSGTSSTFKMSQDERMKKYFAAILKDNEKQGQRKLRILPTNDGSSPFKEVWFHEILLDGKWQKFYDPGKNDNERSPLTEVYEELMSTGKESDKELAKQYKARKFYIVKLIDRDNENDGVKFWRFKHNYKNEGVLDKIIPIWRAKGDITDAENGRDIILELAKAKTPKGATYTVIQTIMHDDPTPLHKSKDISSGWITDELGWDDSTTNWISDIEIYYDELYNLNNCNLFTNLKGITSVRHYEKEKIELDLDEEFKNIIKYANITNNFK